jgi:precorrin-2 methylase
MNTELTQQQTLIEVVSELPSKANIQRLANDIIQQVKEGGTDPLKLAVQMKFIQEVFEQVRSGINDDVLSELDKYAKGEPVTSMGATLEKMEAGVKYDYSNCGDPAYYSFKNTIKMATDGMKEREAFLKTIKGQMVIADESTGGEQITINPPVKSSTSTFKITLAK